METVKALSHLPTFLGTRTLHLSAPCLTQSDTGPNWRWEAVLCVRDVTFPRNLGVPMMLQGLISTKDIRAWVLEPPTVSHKL